MLKTVKSSITPSASMISASVAPARRRESNSSSAILSGDEFAILAKPISAFSFSLKSVFSLLFDCYVGLGNEDLTDRLVCC